MELKERQARIEAEFMEARDSRAKGNEGRARVCARRAAGIAIGIYFERNTGESPPRSAYELLQWYSRREEIPDNLRESAERLTVRVTPEYKLPHIQDPLEDARFIVAAILDGSI
ncbi:MAG: hypothetical protein A2Z14_04095 [Chloroflexi bacterium RBG_16_48_8]|nr:MAG: hypothetical protein A2Z14_04095 [Chloroflexi bacterium RBG_16_48_8]